MSNLIVELRIIENCLLTRRMWHPSRFSAACKNSGRVFGKRSRGVRENTAKKCHCCSNMLSINSILMTLRLFLESLGRYRYTLGCLACAGYRCWLQLSFVPRSRSRCDDDRLSLVFPSLHVPCHSLGVRARSGVTPWGVRRICRSRYCDAVADDAVLSGLVASPVGVAGVIAFGLAAIGIALSGTPPLTRN